MNFGSLRCGQHRVGSFVNTIVSEGIGIVDLKQQTRMQCFEKQSLCRRLGRAQNLAESVDGDAVAHASHLLERLQ